MTDVEARVGIAQLKKYDEIVRRRQENATYYNKKLQDIPDFDLPPIVGGATYSHYVIRVPDREKIIRAMSTKGVQLGQLIEYSVPHMSAYTHYAETRSYPNSYLCSQHTINIPLYSELQKDTLRRIFDAVKQASSELLGS